MLYKDDNRLYLTDTHSGFADKAREFLEELRGMANKKGIVRFKTLPGMKNPGLFIPLQATVKTKTGSYVMRYATNIQTKGDQKVYTPTTIRWPSSGIVDLNRDPELAVFLYGYSTLCLNGRNPNKSTTCWFMVENPEQETQVKITSKKLIGKITTMVLETLDEGGAPLQLVMNYAKSKGLRFSDESEKIIRMRAFELIESRDLFEEFMQSLTDRKYFEYSNMLDKAVEYNVLQLMKLSRTDDHKAWRFINEDGSPGDVVCKVPIRSNARGYMLEELENNRYLAEQIRERLDEVMDSDEEINSDVKAAKDFKPLPVPEKPVVAEDTRKAEEELEMLLQKSSEEIKHLEPVDPPKQPDPPAVDPPKQPDPPKTGRTGNNSGTSKGATGATVPKKGPGKGPGKGKGGAAKHK